MITLIDRVAELRAEHGSYAKAARATGVNQATLYRLAHGQLQLPTTRTLEKLGLSSDKPKYARL